MQAVWISTFGGPEVLEVRTVGKPPFNHDQVLIRVRASSLNRADLLQRQEDIRRRPAFPRKFPAWNSPARSPRSAPPSAGGNPASAFSA